ncbi:MAG: antibiotic biosynthesis monooxygenase, partial [Kordiimonas sp.]
KPELYQEFESTWRNMTRMIHQNVEGALGSICLRALDSPDEMITIATWKTEDEWRAFIKEAKGGSMRTLHDLASLVDAAPYLEIGDETVLAE